jgi:FlaA1/EpsC-like NDP-sugar epimerase
LPALKLFTFPMFKRINILPQWAIFFIDIFISIAALFISYMVRNEFSFNQIDKTIFFKNSVILVSLCVPIFIFLKTYAGIIRLTTIQDAVRIFVAVVLINAGFVVVYLIASVFFHKSFISITTLVINGFVGFVMLIIYRLAIKHFFSYFKNLKIDNKNVIIYGANEEGIGTRRTLEQDQQIHYRITAFIDYDVTKTKKVVDGINTYHPSDLPKLILQEKVDELIIASETLSAEKKNELIDICLDKGVKVLHTPPIRTWVNGQLSTRQIHKVTIEELLERESIPTNDAVIEAQVKNKRILITGAAGSIGHELVRQLARFNPEVIILVDTAETALYELELSLKTQFKNKQFRYFVADVRNYRRIENIFRECKPHHVYHAAAYKHVPLMELHPYEAVATNVIGTKNIADLAVKYSVEKFVLVSSDKVAHPSSVVSATQRIAEIYVQSLYRHLNQKKGRENSIDETGDEKHSVTQFITTRFGTVLGSNGSVIPRFAAQIKHGGPVTVTHPDISRYFITIPEACQLILEAGSLGRGGEVFVFSMGNMIRILDLANKMIRLSGLIPGVDIEIKYTGLRPGEKLHEELFDAAEYVTHTHHDQILIATVKEYNYEEVVEDMNSLITMIQFAKDELEIIKMMRKMVPEYLNNHSVYENGE